MTIRSRISPLTTSLFARVSTHRRRLNSHVAATYCSSALTFAPRCLIMQRLYRSSSQLTFSTSSSSSASSGSTTTTPGSPAAHAGVPYPKPTGAEVSTTTNNHTDSSSPPLTTSKMSDYSSHQIGAKNTLDYKLYLKDAQGKIVSPFHDIPLYANPEKTISNMVVEIPRWTNAKLEISKEEAFNPILQDTKKGKSRFVRNCFPHKGYIWNYGAFPQTWEDPNHVHADTKAVGDNDPLDVCEIGEAVGYTGQIKQVKVLGVMALLDDGETDWKIIAIDVKDPHASKVNDIEDVERHFPGLSRATNEWFRIYKIPDGKPENQFAFSGEAKNKAYAQDIIRSCGEAWEGSASGKVDPKGVQIANSTLGNGNTTEAVVAAAAPKPDAPIDPSIDKWFYISGASV